MKTCLDTQTLRFVLLGLIFLFSKSHSVPLQGSSSDEPVKREAGCRHPPRDVCDRSILGPHFYDECIDAFFPCGEDGFILSYAAKRWEMLTSELSHIGPKLENYLHLSEKCFQEKLVTKAKEMAQNYEPNAETCLNFETTAIELMNHCYQQHNVCAVLDPEKNEDHHTVQKHLHSVVEVFRVGGHYFNNTMVDMGIPEAVRSCNEELADELTHTKLPVQVTWCALTRIYHPSAKLPEDERVNEIIEKLSEQLERPSEQFVYSGNDTYGVCSSIKENYEIILWSADPADPLLKLDNLTNDQGVLGDPIRTPAKYFQFSEVKSERKASQCGDGIRQAGEVCDFGNNLIGCNQYCKSTNIYGYECSTDRLAPSVCTNRTEELKRPVLCRSTKRQRQPLAAARAQVPSLPVRSSVESEPINSQPLGTSSAADMFRTSNLSLVLIAVFSLWISRR